MIKSQKKEKKETHMEIWTTVLIIPNTSWVYFYMQLVFFIHEMYGIILICTFHIYLYYDKYIWSYKIK